MNNAIAPNDWGVFRNSDRTGIPFDRFLRLEDLHVVANILHRPLTKHDLACLARCDGEMVQCTKTGEVFQPIRWVHFDDEVFRSISCTRSTQRASLQFAGCFFYEAGKWNAYSGFPYFYTKISRGSQNVEIKTYPCNNKSSLANAYRCNGKKWGSTREFMERQVRDARVVLRLPFMPLHEMVDEAFASRMTT